jgi:SSS family transporter
MLLGIGLWDWAALAVYLGGITLIGVLAARKVKDTADFFMGGRRFGKTFMIFFSFGAGTNGNQAVGVAAKTYTDGMSGIWYQWLWLFATPFYWIIAPFFRRMRALTTGDFYEYRFNRSTAVLYTLLGIWILTINIGVMLKGSAAVITAISGNAINEYWAIGVMTVLFVTYGIAGGLAAAIATDFIQGMLTILLSFLLLPFAFSAVGGFAGLHENITNESMFSLVAPGQINAFHIFMFAINALVGIVTQPHIMGVCGAGRTELDGRVGFAGGNLLKRVCTVAWMLTGMCAVVMYVDLDKTSIDQVYGTMARDLLPKVMPGLVGIFLASLLASVMSSCDAFMVSSSGLFTQNIYRPFIAPNKTSAHYVFVGRVASLLLVLISIWFAFSFENVVEGLTEFWKVAAMMGPAFYLGLFWRRTTSAGAWAGTIGAIIVWKVTGLEMFDGWAALNLPDYMIWDGAFRDSYQMASYLVTSFVLCIAVSLCTPRVSKERLDRFYACLRTPVQENEPHAPEPFTLPEGVEVPAPRRLIPYFDLEIPMPTFEGMAGFAFFWACVGGMIGFVFWMTSWGA